MQQNLILIGMPTAGKSTVGVILAKMLGMEFLDTDLVIQKQTGKKLAEIIAQRGVDGFLEAEAAAMDSVHTQNTVIATGGSAVYSREAMARLGHTGVTVYLAVELQTLKNRLHHARQRGVVLREGQTLDGLFAERAPLYAAAADLTVNEGDGNLEDTVREILTKLDRYKTEKQKGEHSA